jgi:hypothetical protein
MIICFFFRHDKIPIVTKAAFFLRSLRSLAAIPLLVPFVALLLKFWRFLRLFAAIFSGVAYRPVPRIV